MQAGSLLFKPSVLFFLLALVVFVTMVAVNAGETSAQICEPDPSTGICSGGSGGRGGGGGGHVSCTVGQDRCTFSGGAGSKAGGGGGQFILENSTAECVRGSCNRVQG